MTTFTAIATFTLGVVLTVLYIVGKWNLFKKMGLAGWKALIPVYSEYLIFKKAWRTDMFFGALLMSVLSSALGHLAVLGSNVNSVLAVSCLAFAAVATVINIEACYKLAKSFGHGAGYTVGLVVAEPVFTMILGFEKNEFARA